MQLILSNPKRHQGHVQLQLVVAYRHSSALHSKPMTHQNFTFGQGKSPLLVAVPVLSKLLHYETSRYVFSDAYLISESDNYEGIACFAAAAGNGY